MHIRSSDAHPMYNNAYCLHIFCIYCAHAYIYKAHMAHLSTCNSPASPISSNQLHFYYCNITYASLTVQFLCPLPAPAWPALPGPLQAVAGCQACQWRAPEHPPHQKPSHQPEAHPITAAEPEPLGTPEGYSGWTMEGTVFSTPS
jgi:hypothetical protein